ncbi:MAG: hypothetical protein DME59_02690 [Verrucomicrobia bacterium]|nr:MAG: hypothetical protein DME59_02690 [Verrucomicrobiota bacterium]
MLTNVGAGAGEGWFVVQGCVSGLAVGEINFGLEAAEVNQIINDRYGNYYSLVLCSCRCLVRRLVAFSLFSSSP